MYIIQKARKRKKYLYLVKSVRLPDGKTKKIEKTINKKKPLKKLEKEFEKYFLEKEKKLFQEYALNTYKTDSIFTKEQIKKIEEIKVDYSRLLKVFVKEQYKDVFDRFTANFTYESNAIEGSSLTLKDVAIVMFENMTIEGKDLREIYETRNSRKVVDLILKKKFKITEKDIIKMHKILIQNIDSRIGYKKFQNEIIGSNLELTHPKKVKQEMSELIEWYNEKNKVLNPVQIAALFHGKFEKIHPFADGNGRVGRFIINTILLNNNYPPLIVRKTQRQSYIKCLQDFHRGYTGNLERFMLEKYKKTFRKFFQVYLEYI